jgi:hypothetical protein
MASASVSLTISVRDLASVKLLAIALRLLADQMRVEANPRAQELENILDRWERTMGDGGPEDGA